MTTRNKRKLAALNKENCEERPRSNLAQNSSTPRSQEDYLTQVSEEIEGRVTKRLSKEFSRTENRILGALAGLDDFLMNPLLLGHSGTTPEPSRHALNTSQGTNEDDSQNDPRPEAGLFHGQMTQNSGPGEGHYIQSSKSTQFFGYVKSYEQGQLRPSPVCLPVLLQPVSTFSSLQFTRSSTASLSEFLFVRKTLYSTNKSKYLFPFGRVSLKFNIKQN